MLELAPARPREARLLCLVALIVVAGSLLVELARDDSELGWPAFRVPVILCGLGLVVHVALCFLAPKADQVIFPAAFLLNGIGLVMLRRLDVALDFSLAKRHLLWTIVGLGLLVAVLVVVREHRVLQRYSYLLGLAGLIFLAAPLVSPQPVESDARIWIKIGSFSVQPGEFAKVLLVIFFAMLISQKRAFFAVAGKRFLGLVFPRLRDIAPIGLMCFIALLVMAATNDFGPALLLFLTVFGMLYIATGRTSWLLLGIAALVIGGLAVAKVSTKIQTRIANMRDPLADYYNTGNQLSESLFGLSTGGITGSGLGHGHPELIPLAFSDFILGAVGEELGLIGLSAVLMVFTLLVIRMLTTAMSNRDSFGKLLVSGFALILPLQVFVVAGGISGLIPMTGLTTPFMSAGGSSLMANYIIVGLVLRVSHHAATLEDPTTV